MKKLVAISILFLLILSIFIFPLDRFGSSVFYISLAFAVCALFLSSWNTNVSHGLLYLWLAPKWKDAPALILQSFVLFVACVTVTMAITGIFLLAGVLDTKNVYDKIILLPWPVLILAFTLAPIGEEMFFRGFVFRKISEWLVERRANERWVAGQISEIIPWMIGALASSVFFALMHASYGSIAELAVAFAVGLVLCVGVKRTNSLVPAVLAHAAFNFVSIFMAVFL